MPILTHGTAVVAASATLADGVTLLLVAGVPARPLRQGLVG